LRYERTTMREECFNFENEVVMEGKKGMRCLQPD
jgi:hypothetical protein